MVICRKRKGVGALKLSQILKTILLYICIFIVCTILFVAMFHMRFLDVIDVYFYKGCIFICICSIVAFLLITAASKVFRNLEINWKDKLVVPILFLGITFGYFTVGPMVIERSFSVFMLSYMQEAKEAGVDGITSNELEKQLFDTFFEEYGQLEKRLNEQTISGNIRELETMENQPPKYEITDQAGILVELFRFIAKLFNMSTELVYPKGHF